MLNILMYSTFPSDGMARALQTSNQYLIVLTSYFSSDYKQ